MATFNKINSFSENLAEKQIDLGGSGLKIALTNTAHNSAWDELADLTEISYTNLSSRAITVTSSAQTSGTYKLVLQDLVLTASGGSVGPFRYVYIYDDASTGDKLIGYYDIGSAVTLNDADFITIDFDASAGTITLV